MKKHTYHIVIEQALFFITIPIKAKTPGYAAWLFDELSLTYDQYTVLTLWRDWGMHDALAITSVKGRIIRQYAVDQNQDR